MANLDATNGKADDGQREPDAHDLLRERRLQRNLKILVAFLGFLILSGLAAVVLRVLFLASQPQSPPTIASSVAADPRYLELPTGARVISVSAADERIVVHYEGPSGTGIAVIDLATGRRLFDIEPRPGPAAPAN
jgi:hypothetical protein